MRSRPPSRSLDSDDVDIAITEIGGTAGDIESLPFLEAIRQYRQEIGRKNGIFIHMTLVPFLSAAGEMKTKPSQQSVGILRSIGIIPDILICRCERHLTDEHREKMALFCNVDQELVIEEKDVDHSIYEVPLELTRENLDVKILEHLNMDAPPLDLADWQEMVDTLKSPENGSVEIAVVGKYTSLRDSYKSIYEALTHGGIANSVNVLIRMIESEEIEEKGCEALLSGVDGILVPGGFGDRGVEGKIATATYALEQNIPYFGICLGMQCAVMAYGRSRCGLDGANSSEFAPDGPASVIHLMEHQREITAKGGTMRLGGYDCVLTEGSRAAAAYEQDQIIERHRHRYEFNNDYRATFEEHGMTFSGLSPDGELVEIVEIDDHPWFVACQFHPEFQSTPLKAHPLFAAFIKGALENQSA